MSFVFGDEKDSWNLIQMGQKLVIWLCQDANSHMYFISSSITVKLKPSQLNVPDKGKKQFEAAFGESWDSAGENNLVVWSFLVKVNPIFFIKFLQRIGYCLLYSVAAGKVYNAKDGAEKLGFDAEGVNAEWSKLTRGKDLIKFGGGFYCGKVKDIYVMNGFYMSMRAGKCWWRKESFTMLE